MDNIRDCHSAGCLCHIGKSVPESFLPQLSGRGKLFLPRKAWWSCGCPNSQVRAKIGAFGPGGHGPDQRLVCMVTVGRGQQRLESAVVCERRERSCSARARSSVVHDSAQALLLGSPPDRTPRKKIGQIHVFALKVTNSVAVSLNFFE